MALRDDVLKHYPQFAWALENSEIAKVLEDAVKGEWDSGRLLAGLQETNWWKHTVPSAREYQEKQKTDPASLDESIRQLDAKLWDISRSLGLNLAPNVVDDIARQGVQFGWNEAQMQDALVVQARDRGYQGQEGNLGAVSSNIAALRKQASQFMVGLDDKTAFGWAIQMAAGEKKAEDFDVLFRDWAKAKFAYDPQTVANIDAGFKPEELFAPQRNAIAKLMETNPENIDLQNPKWQQVLDYADPSTGQRRAMTETEAQKLARSTTEWRKTQNGQQAGAQIVASMSKMFRGI